MYFYAQSGTLQCENCHTGGMELSISVVSAMRYIIYSEFKKVFSFTLTDDALEELTRASERYLLAQVGRGFSTLEFYHSVDK